MILVLMLSFLRQELLHWLNSLLQLNITKVEQCGTGYACLDLPSRIYLPSRCVHRFSSVSSQWTEPLRKAQHLRCQESELD
jgi:hypothetical protein